MSATPGTTRTVTARPFDYPDVARLIEANELPVLYRSATGTEPYVRATIQVRPVSERDAATGRRGHRRVAIDSLIEPPKRRTEVPHVFATLVNVDIRTEFGISSGGALFTDRESWEAAEGRYYDRSTMSRLLVEDPEGFEVDLSPVAGVRVSASFIVPVSDPATAEALVSEALAALDQSLAAAGLPAAERRPLKSQMVSDRRVNVYSPIGDGEYRLDAAYVLESEAWMHATEQGWEAVPVDRDPKLAPAVAKVLRDAAQ